MNYTESLTRYTANFIDELARNGMTDVVISPGSRSTPLALVFREHPSIKEWIVIDERSAAFFALGLAKKSKRPVALVCTSGTAAANYYPAVVEAFYSRVPLLVLTADRPHELRQVGAPQAIEQIKMYGDYVKWFHEMATPEGTPPMLRYARQKAAQAFAFTEQGNKGPVQVNFPFREPLTPDFTLPDIWGAEKEKSTARINRMEGMKYLGEEQIQELTALFGSSRKGLLVCGPEMNVNFAERVCELAQVWNLPVLADPLSQLRTGEHDKTHVIEGYDAFLRDSEIRERLQPDYIIRFGAMPVSKAYLFYVKEHSHIPQFVVEENEGFRDPTGNDTAYIYADPRQLCSQLIEKAPDKLSTAAWLDEWLHYNQIAKNHLLSGEETQVTEGEAARGIAAVIPDQTTLYVGNSMAVRDVDSFFMVSSKAVSILCNRGANGIDGVISSAVGAAAAGQRVTLLIGDLSFFHDMNGLLAAKQYQLPITIVLVNNNGGGIFSFLPQANDKKHFEALFGTPVDLPFEKAGALYGAAYQVVSTERALKEQLEQSYQQSGLSIIEVKTDRDENAVWHREKWNRVMAEIKEGWQ
ncbi:MULTISPECIES: 2-succinyl-5-enolpyruvyl-6-hydroxy-3-cyclohexene-1-carboxylic-acid synthase [Oceanobacillus]|uniref:2-succinyl-5-enolpyruvyl-6-hydroxy-3-cyclohexene-1-carboxylate synthase n=1 Tax=Oceanobacillus aidingensis TaxID=645964 RepID=A0ABV9K0D1_9BACI|nr:2-succinyl-5-enolpyruvyl-6-hydroxy-3-cyclohexene-1-carboxylic-acid synthase [Oceanobacillus oncorhynchi]MDM8098487.1 2-succinyl-5-enolpyruvyl-6-hydroxy-3-cyclohexene-1-carboxylic-acid synthase [Oceanobacillus oncorhynchi]